MGKRRLSLSLADVLFFVGNYQVLNVFHVAAIYCTSSAILSHSTQKPIHCSHLGLIIEI